MLWEIIKKEVHEIVISPKFIFTFILCTILILLSVVMGISNYKVDQQEYDRAVVMNRQELENRSSYNEIGVMELKSINNRWS